MAATALQPSRYNISFQGFDGTACLFNSATLALVALHPDHAAAIKQLLADPFGAQAAAGGREWLEALLRGRFLVPEGTDEQAEFERLERRARHDTSHLIIYPFPTLSCNVACPYCFIGRQPVRMTEAIEASLLELVAAKAPAAQRLTAVWYGGEPLLELPRIRRLSAALMAEAAALGIDYDAGIYTNGHLLTRSVALELRRLGVRIVHTACDGPKEVHDQRRALADGGPTYDALLHNLQDIAGIFDRILLRVHIDRATAPGMERLFDDLHDRGFHHRQDVVIRFAPLEDEAPASVWATPVCYETPEYARIEAELARAALSRGLITVAYPFHRPVYCMARKENEFAVGPDGRIFHCLAEVGLADNATGALAAALPAPDPVGNTQRFRNDTFASKENCRICRILPLCAGGCAHNGFVRHGGRRGYCIGLKYNIVAVLRIYHALLMRARPTAAITYLVDPVEPERSLQSVWNLHGEPAEDALAPEPRA